MTTDSTRLDALREYYDVTDLSEVIDQADADDSTVDMDTVMVSTSIRLPRPLMQRIRSRAVEAGVPATTLIRQWVVDRLDAHPDDTVVSVADLHRFIAERSHPAA